MDGFLKNKGFLPGPPDSDYPQRFYPEGRGVLVRTYPSSANQFVSMSGYSTAPDSLYLFTASSGNESDLIGSNHLSASGTLTRGGFDVPLATKCVETTHNVDGNLVAGDVFDTDLTTSIAGMGIIRFPSGSGALQLNILGKDAGGALWSVRVGGANTFRLIGYDGAAGLFTADIVSADIFDGRVVHFLFKINRTSQRAQLWTSVANSPESNISAHGSYGNAANFAGCGGSNNTPAFKMAMLAMWSGAGAEGVTSTHMSNLRTAQGFA